MRKEATLEEWGKLYDLAEQYAQMKPWNWLANEEIVCVSIPDEERVYFSVMGNGGLEYGFGMYIGDLAFREMQLQINDPAGEEYSLYMQNCIVMFIDDKEMVPPEQMEILRELGRSYGKGRKWIYFENHARGYFPYIPDRQDVQKTTRYLEALISALPRIEKLKPRGLHLVGQGFIHKLEQSEWKTGIVTWDPEELCRLPYSAPHESLKEEAAKWKQLRAVWEVDVILTNIVETDEGYDRPLFPHLLLVMDHRMGTVVYQQMLYPSDDPPALCQYLTRLMREHGKPKKLLVSGDMMKEIFSILESAAGIPVKVELLSQTEEFKEDFQRAFPPGDSGADGSVLKAFGLTNEEIASLLEMSGAETEEELIQILGEGARRTFGNGSGGLFLGAPENSDFSDENESYDEGFFWGFDDEDDNGPASQIPANMRDRVQLIRDFFEWADEASREDPAEENEFDDEPLLSLIDAEWCDDWQMLLEQSSQKNLKELEKTLGISSSGKKKSQLAAEVFGILSEKPARVKELLSVEERALVKHLRTMVNKANHAHADTFPFPKETIISLAEKGMLDIRYGHDFMKICLTHIIPKQMKGLRL